MFQLCFQFCKFCCIGTTVFEFLYSQLEIWVECSLIY
jgi:hypothetical protein